MATTHGHAPAVEQLHHVVWVYIVQDEGDRSPTAVGAVGAQDAHTLDVSQLSEQVLDELTLMSGDVVHAQGADVVDGGTQPDGLGDRRSSGLEPLRRVGVRAAAHLDDFDHLAASFAGNRLAELAAFIADFPAALAVEVRHPQFFERGEVERQLNRLLRDAGVERICLDSRALFSCHDGSAAVLHAQQRKPRLPLRPTAFSDAPQLRFIGHPRLEANDAFLAPWLDKVAAWIEQGLRPHVFLHTPDNQAAPALAQRFHRLLGQRLPGLGELPPLQTQDQISLL